MKQKEKLDAILKILYEDSRYQQRNILSDYQKLDSNYDELVVLTERLKKEGLVERLVTKDSIEIKLTSQGVEYCEEDSFTVQGRSVIQNSYITLNNSPGSNIIGQSPGSSIVQKASQANNILDQITTTTQEDDAIDSECKKEIIECVEEIKDAINSGRKSKSAVRGLLSLISEFASLSSLGISLKQLLLP